MKYRLLDLFELKFTMTRFYFDYSDEDQEAIGDSNRLLSLSLQDWACLEPPIS